MKYTYRIPPSSTETILTIDIPPATAIINQEAPLSSMSGGTPIPPVVEPPVVTPPVDPPTTGTRKNLLFEGLFDSGTIKSNLVDKGWQDEQRNKNAYSLTIVNGALRYELRKTDPLVSQSVRTEVTYNLDAHTWFGGRLKLENWAPNVGSGGESVFQVHSGNNAPPFGIVVWGNSIQFTSTPSDSTGSKRIEIGTVSDWNNKWIDIVVHMYFAKSGGVIELFVNGVSKGKVTGLTSSDLGVYLKLGMNAFCWAPNGGVSNQSVRVFYWDNVRIGNAMATYNDVKP